MENNVVKIAYVHFSGKLPRKYPGKAIVSVAICTDYLGYNLVMKKVEAVDAETTNNKWIDVQALDYTLDFLFRIQSNLISLGVTRIFLVTDNPNLYTYLVDSPLNKTIKSWLNDIYKTYTVFGPKELKLGIGVCNLCERNRSKTYYFEKFVENPEYLTTSNDAPSYAKKVKRVYVFNDFDNLIPASSLLNEAKIEGIDEIEELS